MIIEAKITVFLGFLEAIGPNLEFVNQCFTLIIATKARRRGEKTISVAINLIGKTPCLRASVAK